MGWKQYHTGWVREPLWGPGFLHFLFCFCLSCLVQKSHPVQPTLGWGSQIEVPSLYAFCLCFLFLFLNCWASASVGPRGHCHSRGSQPPGSWIYTIYTGKLALLVLSHCPSSLPSCDELERGNCWGFSYKEPNAQHKPRAVLGFFQGGP